MGSEKITKRKGQKNVSSWAKYKFWNFKSSPVFRFKPETDEVFRAMSIEQLLHTSEEVMRFAETREKKPDTRLLLNWLNWSFLHRLEHFLINAERNKEQFESFENLEHLRKRFHQLDKRVQELIANSPWWYEGW